MSLRASFTGRTYHQSIGESCNYLSMKAEMLFSVRRAADTSWLEFPDLVFSSFDFSDIS